MEIVHVMDLSYRKLSSFGNKVLSVSRAHTQILTFEQLHVVSSLSSKLMHNGLSQYSHIISFLSKVIMHILYRRFDGKYFVLLLLFLPTVRLNEGKSWIVFK